MFRNMVSTGKLQRSGALISNISFVCNNKAEYLVAHTTMHRVTPEASNNMFQRSHAMRVRWFTCAKLYYAHRIKNTLNI